MREITDKRDRNYIVITEGQSHVYADTRRAAEVTAMGMVPTVANGDSARIYALIEGYMPDPEVRILKFTGGHAELPAKREAEECDS
jgi:hypothetical protein